MAGRSQSRPRLLHAGNRTKSTTSWNSRCVLPWGNLFERKRCCCLLYAILSWRVRTSSWKTLRFSCPAYKRLSALSCSECRTFWERALDSWRERKTNSCTHECLCPAPATSSRCPVDSRYSRRQPNFHTRSWNQSQQLCWFGSYQFIWIIYCRNQKSDWWSLASLSYHWCSSCPWPPLRACCKQGKTIF